jgi:hypothetical protein
VFSGRSTSIPRNRAPLKRNSARRISICKVEHELAFGSYSKTTRAVLIFSAA